MTAKLTIAFSEELLRLLKSNKALKLSLGSGRGGAGSGGDGPRRAAGRRGGRRGKRGGGRRKAGGFREGSLPARILAWAGGRAKTFSTNDVSRKFKLSRAHASMLLSRLSTVDKAIRRAARGVYSAK